MANLYEPITIPDFFQTADYGLLTAVNWLTPTNSRWQNGITYQADCYALDVTFDPCIVSGMGTDINKLETWSRSFRGSMPFTTFAEEDCSAPIAYEDGQRQVLTALGHQNQFQLENQLWTGDGRGGMKTYPNLITDGGPIFAPGSNNIITLQPDLLAITGNARDVVEALGLLEAQMGYCYSGAGVIHVTLEILEQMCANVLVYNRGGKLYTWAGNQVVAGRGYISSRGPTAVTAGTSWMFATSPIFGIQGQPRTFEPRESIDRSVNTMKFIAEQTFILGWTCCLIGILVSTGGVVQGTAGAAN